MVRLTVLTEEIKRAVANRYLQWGIILDDAIFSSVESHFIQKKGWEIRFIEGENEKGKYVEFYDMNNITGDTHYRVYTDGEIEELEAIAEGFTYDVSVPGDREVKHKEYVENNKRIYEELKEIGLYK